MIILASDHFWGIYDPIANSYSLVCLDLSCPPEVTATSQSGDRYQVKTGEHATQMQLVALSDAQLPTKKL
jgi:hypothetical protein